MAAKGSGKSKRKDAGLGGYLSRAWQGLHRRWVLSLLVLVAISIFFGAKVTIGQEGVSLIPHLWAKTNEPKPAKAPAANALATSTLTQQIATLQANTIPLDALPPELRGNGSRDDAIRLINELLAAHNNSFATVESCMQWLDYGIARRRLEINTAKALKSQDVEYQGYVRSLQVCMTILGYYKGAIDGQCTNLLNSVLDFQKANGLKPDGIVGLQTWTKIKAQVLATLNRRTSTP